MHGLNVLVRHKDVTIMLHDETTEWSFHTYCGQAEWCFHTYSLFGLTYIWESVTCHIDYRLMLHTHFSDTFIDRRRLVQSWLLQPVCRVCPVLMLNYHMIDICGFDQIFTYSYMHVWLNTFVVYIQNLTMKCSIYYLPEFLYNIGILPLYPRCCIFHKISREFEMSLILIWWTMDDGKCKKIPMLVPMPYICHVQPDSES